MAQVPRREEFWGLSRSEERCGQNGPGATSDELKTKKNRGGQAIASMAASVRVPGTIVTGMAWEPVANMETRGPGPALPVPAARIRLETSLSSFSTWLPQSI